MPHKDITLLLRLQGWFVEKARRFGEVRRLCIDEVAYRKGQRYLTVVSDYDRHEVIWVGKGRDKATFFDGWLHRAQDRKLEPFAMLCEQLDRWREGLLNYFVHRIANGLARR